MVVHVNAGGDIDAVLLRREGQNRTCGHDVTLRGGHERVGITIDQPQPVRQRPIALPRENGKVTLLLLLLRLLLRSVRHGFLFFPSVGTAHCSRERATNELDEL